jgi:hypothetical protein
MLAAAGRWWVARIQRFTNRAQAEVACGLLAAHGIDAYVSSDDAGGNHPHLAYGFSGTAIVVPDDQLEDATSLLDDRLPQEAPEDDAGWERSGRSVAWRSLVLALAILIALVAVVATLSAFVR